ncbi:MAG: rRNA maturation RNase YbeY [Ignavibacteriales bacterium]|nr:rRNA maturation RNase YbeY [Ignavibacteriales bacterium]MBK7979638.1 rRNA maturation RNase YbeY [Ignavibacteriota bacterium]
MIKNLTVNSDRKIKINKNAIHKIISLLKSEFSFDVISLPINFITSEQIIPINTQYLGHNFSTDIITFNYSGENDSFDGEIFISVDDAFSNSKKYKVSLDNEIIRLVIHGILHLLGFDDKNKFDLKKMKKEENRLVSEFEKNTIKIIIKYDC